MITEISGFLNTGPMLSVPVIGDITDAIVDLVKDILCESITGYLNEIFDFFTDKTNSAAGLLSQSPSSFSGVLFNLAKTVSDNVMIPIAAVIVALVLCYEIITMIIDKNNFSDGDETLIFIKFAFKGFIAITLINNAYKITNAIFDVGTDACSQVISLASLNYDASAQSATLASAFESQKDSLGVGQLVVILIQCVILSLIFIGIGMVMLITVYSRMVMIYIYTSIAPVTFATLSNKELQNTGVHFIKQLISLAFQAVFLILILAMFKAMLDNFTPTGEFTSELWKVCALGVALAVTASKSGNISEAIFGC